MMTRGRCWGRWSLGGRVTCTSRGPGSLQGAAILPGEPHHRHKASNSPQLTAGGDIITPFISYILPRLNIAALLWYLLSGCRSSRSLPLVNYSDVLFTVQTRAGNEAS